jgi:hypothetical protein
MRSLVVVAGLLASVVTGENLRGEEEVRGLKSLAQKAAKEAAGAHYYELKAKTTKAVPDNGLNAAKAAAAASADSSDADAAAALSVPILTPRAGRVNITTLASAAVSHDAGEALGSCVEWYELRSGTIA